MRHRSRARIRLIALDLDGTLLSSRKTITPLTHTAIKAAVKAGVKVVLATARPPRLGTLAITKRPRS